MPLVAHRRANRETADAPLDTSHGIIQPYETTTRLLIGARQGGITMSALRRSVTRVGVFGCLIPLAWLTLAFRPTLAQHRPSSPSAFFYQTVTPQAATVRAGATYDGTNIWTYDVNLVNANDGIGAPGGYGDPVFSMLPNGRWAMTATARPNDPRGVGLMYYEGMCPIVDRAKVRVISARSAPGCNARATIAMAKTSQVFAVDGSNYVFTMSGAEIYLTRLTDSTRTASELTSICVKPDALRSIHDLAWGDSGRVITRAQAQDLLLSDTAIARRTDGTWVLFVKGIARSAACPQGSLCELCSRSIYRTLSRDLVHWAELENVVRQASVPDATTYPDGRVWLYYQNFARACATNDKRLADRAPITGAFELEDGTLSYGFDVKVSNETFETDTRAHYATNGNPIALRDDETYEALNACMGGKPR
jgi:hypothetical protein